MFKTFTKNLLLTGMSCALLAVGGCLPKMEKPEAVRGGTEHLLLLSDRVMRYQERHGAKEKSFEMYMFYGGGVVSKMYETRFKGIDLGECAFTSQDKRVYFSTSKPLTYFEARPDYRQCWVDETAKRGDSWEDEETGTQTVFAGFESVTVPSGTYDQCYKTVTTALPWLADSIKAAFDRGNLSGGDFERLGDNSKLTVVRWFASGVGLVKEEIGGSDYVRELVEIVNPGYGKVIPDTTAAK